MSAARPTRTIAMCASFALAAWVAACGHTGAHDSMQFVDHGNVDAGRDASDASPTNADAGADGGGDGGLWDGSIRID